jgi:hypothetical protein
MRKPIGLVVLVFAATALGAWAAEAKAAKRYVRFESGHELLISDVREEGEWMIFELADGGELGVQKSRIQKVGETGADGMVFVIGPMEMLERTGAAATRGSGHAAQGSPGDSQTAATARDSWGALGGVGGVVQKAPGEAEPSSSESKLPLSDEESEEEKEEQPPEAPKMGFILSMGAPEFASTGQSFMAEVVALGVQDLGHVGFYVRYPETLLMGVTAEDGGFLTSDGEQASFQVRVRQDKGLVIVGISRYSKTVGVSGSGTVLRMTFRALAPGDATLSFTNVSAKTAARANLPVSVVSASISID